MPLYRWIYISVETSTLTTPEIAALLNQSRARNLTLKATGLLLYADNSFIQVLEAPQSNLEELKLSILEDSRHESVITLREGLIEHREFPDWQMGFAHHKIDHKEFVRLLDGVYDFFDFESGDSQAWRLLQSFWKEAGKRTSS